MMELIELQIVDDRDICLFTSFSKRIDAFISDYVNKLKSLIAPVNASVNASVNIILSDLQIQILEIIEADPLVSYEDIALKSGKDRAAIRRNIQKLKSLGVLQRLGSDKKGMWKTERTL